MVPSLLCCTRTLHSGLRVARPFSSAALRSPLLSSRQRTWVTTTSTSTSEATRRFSSDTEEDEEPEPIDQEYIEPFLKSFGMDDHADKFTSWGDLVNCKTRALKRRGVETKDRKKILRKVESWKQADRMRREVYFAWKDHHEATSAAEAKGEAPPALPSYLDPSQAPPKSMFI